MCYRLVRCLLTIVHVADHVSKAGLLDGVDPVHLHGLQTSVGRQCSLLLRTAGPVDLGEETGDVEVLTNSRYRTRAQPTEGEPSIMAEP